jgi:hypothetical protein
MADQIVGSAELLLSPDEVVLFDQQAAAQASGDVDKGEADYQNEPNDGEQCSGCDRFVPGFPNEVAGYCTKVKSFKGPLGMIFEDGWCKYFTDDQATQRADAAFFEASQGESDDE